MRSRLKASVIWPAITALGSSGIVRPPHRSRPRGLALSRRSVASRHEWPRATGVDSSDTMNPSCATTGWKNGARRPFPLHEPDNRADPNAIAVFIEGRRCGHLPRSIAPECASVVEGITALGLAPHVRADARGGWRFENRDWADFGITVYMAPAEGLLARFEAPDEDVLEMTRLGRPRTIAIAATPARSPLRKPTGTGGSSPAAFVGHVPESVVASS